MRPIKFRGKRIDNGEWVYGYFLKRTICDGEGECSYIKFDGNGGIRVLPETVGQFTGLYDKNGVEIYEEDLCQVSGEYCGDHYVQSHIAKVYFESGEFLFESGLYNDTLRANPYLLKVIGNIHERSEG